jgi:Shedu protein SduA, C-terminal
MPKDRFTKQNGHGDVFVEIDRRSRNGRYRVLPKSNQRNYCEEISLDGFDHLPSGFYTNDGYGLTGAGLELLREIHSKYKKKISLTVSSDGAFRIDGRGRTVAVNIPHDLLSEVNAEKRAIRSQRASEVQAAVRGFLAAHAPRQFGEYRDSRPEYAAGSLAHILSRDRVTARMNQEDEKALQAFIPNYLSEISGTLRSTKKIQIIADSIDAGRKVYLEKVLQEFNKKLSNRVQNEATWQSFLAEHILIFRHTYGEILDRQSIRIIEGKYPDFMLVDPYSYVDIYEIKTPATVLMNLDRSRNNHYWSAELSKAIAQVEKYLHDIQRNSDTFRNELREAKGIDINIVRPRGYIVAGKRADIRNNRMRNDFRILNESLKNIDIILYDDLVSNLEAFLARLASS